MSDQARERLMAAAAGVIERLADQMFIDKTTSMAIRNSAVYWSDQVIEAYEAELGDVVTLGAALAEAVRHDARINGIACSSAAARALKAWDAAIKPTEEST